MSQVSFYVHTYSIGNKSSNHDSQKSCWTFCKACSVAQAIMWVGIILLKQHITFLLQENEWYASDVQKYMRLITYSNLHHSARVGPHMLRGTSLLWNMSLSRSKQRCKRPSLAWKHNLFSSLNTTKWYLISQV